MLPEIVLFQIVDDLSNVVCMRVDIIYFFECLHAVWASKQYDSLRRSAHTYENKLGAKLRFLKRVVFLEGALWLVLDCITLTDCFTLKAQSFDI